MYNTTVNYTSHPKTLMEGDRCYSTYGLGEAICTTVRPHTEPFCAGKCAEKSATHKLHGIGKARLIKPDEKDRCPHCWGTVSWTNKYRQLRKTSENTPSL